jgi:hypothetical protein
VSKNSNAFVLNEIKENEAKETWRNLIRVLGPVGIEPTLET